MDWLQRMNWSHLQEDVAERVWEEAHRRYFEEDEPLEPAFENALREQGYHVESP
jgi:hypothetical protein